MHNRNGRVIYTHKRDRKSVFRTSDWIRLIKAHAHIIINIRFPHLPSSIKSQVCYYWSKNSISSFSCVSVVSAAVYVAVVTFAKREVPQTNFENARNAQNLRWNRTERESESMSVTKTTWRWISLCSTYKLRKMQSEQPEGTTLAANFCCNRDIRSINNFTL